MVITKIRRTDAHLQGFRQAHGQELLGEVDHGRC